MPSESIRILLVDDHTLFRSGLRFLLETQKDFAVVGEASDGREAMALAQSLKPDVILLDLDMSPLGGREILPYLLDTDPSPAVLVLTVSENSAALMECMKLGARGYLLKNINTDFLLDSIRKALEGDSVLSPEMTTKLIQQLKLPPQQEHAAFYGTLTHREKEILSWLAKGVSNKEIARLLELKESTVKAHVQNVLRKLNLRSRVQAAVYAVEYGYDKHRSDGLAADLP